MEVSVPVGAVYARLHGVVLIVLNVTALGMESVTLICPNVTVRKVIALLLW